MSYYSGGGGGGSYGGGYGGSGGGGYGGSGGGGGYGSNPYGGGGMGGGGGFGAGGLGSSLNQIDFAKQDLVPFEKDFYIEHPDVTKRPEAEAEAWRASKQIVVLGDGVPKPCMTFDEASMPEYILSEVLKQGFDKPTPIQSQGWPMALKGKNMVGISATGSGKTLAFLLPAMIHINAQVSCLNPRGRIRVCFKALYIFVILTERYFFILSSAFCCLRPTFAAISQAWRRPDRPGAGSNARTGSSDQRRVRQVRVVFRHQKYRCLWWCSKEPSDSRFEIWG